MIKKKILFAHLAFLMCSSSLLAMKFGDMRELDNPMTEIGSHFSPALGADDLIVKNMRFYGPYGTTTGRFPLISREALKLDDQPQDAVAYILQRLFPSPAHDYLIANNIQGDEVKKWINPQSIAKIFNLIGVGEHKDYVALSREERIAKIFEILHPQAFNQSKGKAERQSKQSKNKITFEEAILNLNKNSQAVVFASIMEQAIEESYNNQEILSRYPKHVIERILLTYMWHTAEKKDDLKPFYDNLSETFVNKNEIIDWNKTYTEEDYKKIEDYAAGVANVPSMSPTEFFNLLNLGYSEFRDVLPPEAKYTTSFHIDKDDKNNYSFTNCAETAIFNFLNAVFYDGKEKKFIFEREQLSSDNFLERFKNFYLSLSPSQVKSTAKVGEWGTLISDLNSDSDPDPIKYFKLKGEKLDSSLNGNYEVDTQLTNILRVIGKLLKPTEWQYMNQSDEIGRFSAVKHNLTLLCKLLSTAEKKIDWSIDNAKEVKSEYGNIIFTVSNFSSSNSSSSFELNLSSNHAEYRKKNFFQDFSMLMMDQWDPLFRYMINTHNMTSITDMIDSSRDLSSLFYSLDLDSMEGKVAALKSLRKIKRPSYTGASFLPTIGVPLKKEETPIQYEEIISYGLIPAKKWFTAKGENFGYWTDHYTTRNTLDQYLSNKILTIEEMEDIFEKANPNDFSAMATLELFNWAYEKKNIRIIHSILRNPDIF